MKERDKKKRNAQQEWLTNISHELRTPIAILQAQVEALQDGVQNITDESLAVLHEKIIELSNLVNDIHKLAQIDSGEFKLNCQNIYIESILKTTLEQYKEKFKDKNISLEYISTLTKEYNGYFDELELSEVFDKLLNNSFRYTNKNGIIQIESKIENNKFLIRISDSSPCPNKEMISKLFDRFYRAESSRNRSSGGSGLGLAICKSIIEAHNGSISAHESHLGGLQIDIRLPIR